MKVLVSGKSYVTSARWLQVLYEQSSEQVQASPPGSCKAWPCSVQGSTAKCCGPDFRTCCCRNPAGPGSCAAALPCTPKHTLATAHNLGQTDLSHSFKIGVTRKARAKSGKQLTARGLAPADLCRPDVPQGRKRTVLRPQQHHMFGIGHRAVVCWGVQLRDSRAL